MRAQQKKNTVTSHQQGLFPEIMTWLCFLSPSTHRWKRVCHAHESRDMKRKLKQLTTSSVDDLEKPDICKETVLSNPNPLY